MAYDFRIRFHLPSGFYIESDQQRIDLLTNSSGQKLYIKAVGSNALKNTRQIAVRGEGFSSSDEARNAAEIAKAALLRWAVETRTGIDFGDGRARGIIATAGRELLRDSGVTEQVRNDVHGIDVFESSPNVRFLSVQADLEAGQKTDLLRTLFVREYSRAQVVTEKQLLACEMYAGSFFDISKRSRFITLVTAVEALLEPEPRSSDAQSLVKRLIDQVNDAAIDDRTKSAMIGSLSWLRTESIGQAGRSLVNRLLDGRTYGDKSAVTFFTDSYNLRSTILHEGKVPAATDIWQAAAMMEQFVADLLIASLTAPSAMQS